MAFTFDESYYLTQYPDVAAAVSLGYFKSAYDHYVKFGAKELRNPNEFFNAQEYAAANPDVLSAVSAHNFASVWDHYVAYGLAEGRAPSKALAGFDSAAYLAANADVAAAVEAGSFHNALEHYLNFGAKEGRPLGTGVEKYTLTNDTDKATANVFEAGLVYTPGGDDRINSLQDEDVLTGKGENPTLNATLGNANDNGGGTITPKLIGIETINVAFTGSGTGPQGNGPVTTLNLEDASGLKEINVSRIVAEADVIFDNLKEAGTNSFSLDNISVPTTVNFLFQDGVLEGTADAATVALKGVNLKGLTIQSKDGHEGFESITIKSVDSANTVKELKAADLANLTILGDKNLTIANLATATSTEYVAFTKNAIKNDGNVLKTIDASALEGKLTIDLSGYTGAQKSPANSGEKYYLDVKGGSADDTFIIGTDTADSGLKIDGGEGSDTLVLYANLTDDTKTAVKTAVTSVENLKVITQTQATVTVDTNLIAGLGAVTVRNEQPAGATGTFNLNKLSATAAANIFVKHSVTNSNALTENQVNAQLADASGKDDTVAINLVTDLNTEERFNLALNATGDVPTGKAAKDYVVENITINDLDNESNTVKLDAYATHTGKIVLKGGETGQFLNLDATVNAADSGYDLDVSGGTTLDGTYVASLATKTLDTAVGTVFKGFGNGAAERLVAKTIDASEAKSDVIVRVGQEDQAITLGKGNDTVIFDALNDERAGLTIKDTVKGGEGTDTLAIDGDFAGTIRLGASEWTNVSGIDVVRLGSNAGGYELTITNNLIGQTDAGNRLTIVNNDGLLKEANENAATINLRDLDDKHFVTFVGANGVVGFAANPQNRIQLSDVNANGGHILDGGDRIIDETAGTAASGNGNIYEVFNNAVVTIGDLANVKNFSRIEFSSDASVAQTLTLQLNDTVVDALADASHTAAADTALVTNQDETLEIAAKDSTTVAGAYAQLNLDASAVTNKFILEVGLSKGTDDVKIGTAATGATTGAQAWVVARGVYAAGTYAGVDTVGRDLTAANTVSELSAADKVAAGNAINDTLETYGTVVIGAGVTGFENFIFHSDVTIAATVVNNARSLTFADEGAGVTQHTLTLTAGGVLDLSELSFSVGSDDTLVINVVDGAVVTNYTSQIGKIYYNITGTGKVTASANPADAAATVPAGELASAITTTVTVAEALAATSPYAAGPTVVATGTGTVVSSLTITELGALNSKNVDVLKVTDGTVLELSAAQFNSLGTITLQDTGNDALDNLVIRGSNVADTINLASVPVGTAVVVFGGLGNDTITARTGATDTIVFNSAGATSADTINNFTAGAGGDSLVFDLSDFGLASGTTYVGAIAGLAAAGTDKIVVLTGAGYATDELAENAIATQVTGAGSGGIIAAYFNTTTNTTHIITDADADADGSGTVQLVGTVANLTSQALHDGLTAANLGWVA